MIPPLYLTCPPPCLSHAWLDSTAFMTTAPNWLWRVIHASYAKLFFLSSSPFVFCLQTHTPHFHVPFEADAIIPTRAFCCSIRACVSRRCVCTHTSSETLSTPTTHYHNAVRSGGKKSTLQCEKEITFGGIYSNRSEIEEGWGTKKGESGEMVVVGWVCVCWGGGKKMQLSLPWT